MGHRVEPVVLPGAAAPWPADLTAAFAAPPRGRERAVAWAAATGSGVPLPGGGATRARWEALATVGAVDLVTARVVEPHVDALAILAEAGLAAQPGLYGVWAAEGPQSTLTATEGGPAGGWLLSGDKPWCSLAGEVGHGLVTARVATGRGLFEVDATHPGFGVDSSGWTPLGLREVVTSRVTMDRVPARAVGEADWYLRRDGFAWGGIGVAAVWYGGAVALARRLAHQVTVREPDQIALMHLGAVDARLAAAGTMLAASATDIDAGRATGVHGELAAARVRHVVASAAEDVLTAVGHALGPGPLAHEPEFAQRVADLALYLRQHHAERDSVALARTALDAGAW